MRAQRQAVGVQKPPFTLRALWTALNRPRVGALLHIRFFFGLAFAVFQSVFALYAQYRLELDARRTGFILAYVGLLSVLVQGVGVGRLSKRYSDTQLIFSGTIVMGLALMGWVVSFAYRRLVVNPDPPLPERQAVGYGETVVS